MTPEEIAFQQSFLYPLYLILIGGLITGSLIPFFNRLHESKLKNIEREHEIIQKRIDREREDYKFELQIKNEIFKKFTQLESLNWTSFTKMLEEKDPQKILEANSEYYDRLVPLREELEDYLILYLANNEELLMKLQTISSGCYNCASICAMPPNSVERKKSIDEFQEKIKIKINDEEMKKSIETTRVFPTPVYIVHGLIQDMKLSIKKQKIIVN